MFYQIPSTKCNSWGYYMEITSDFVTLFPVSLTHKNPQRRKIINGMRRMQRSIDRSI